jgi:hypothetical protein
VNHNTTRHTVTKLSEPESLGSPERPYSDIVARSAALHERESGADLVERTLARWRRAHLGMLKANIQMFPVMDQSELQKGLGQIGGGA